MTKKSYDTAPSRAGSSRRGFMKSMAASGAGLATAASSAASTPQTETPPSMTSRMRELLARDEPLMAPGVYDVLSARIVESVGFSAAVMGGSACSASMYGVPDYGLVSITELIELAGRLASAIDIPLMADADDAGGSPLNVYRSVAGFARAEVAATMIEDHVQTKHVGHGDALVSTELMVEKIQAAVDARNEKDIVIIARGDAISIGESVDEALRRGRAYFDAGADLLFFAGMNLEDCRRASDEIGAPLMTTVVDTPLETLHQSGIRFAVYAAHAIQLATGAAYRGLTELKRSGRVEKLAELRAPSDAYSGWIRSQDWRERAARYGDQ